MKCSSCGNLIPDGINVCPNCGTNVNVIPVTPTTPVLPQDQNMETVEKLESIDVSVPTNPENVAIPPVYSDQPVINSMENNSNPVMTSNNVYVNSNSPVVSAPIGNSQIVPNAPIQSNLNISTDYIDPSGLVVAERIGSTVGKEVPNGGKGKVLLIALIVIIIRAAIVGGIYGGVYYTQYKTANKRLEKVVENILAFTSNIHNDDIEKKSGNFVIDGNLSYSTTNYYAKTTGNYAIDLSARKLKLDLVLEKLSSTEDLINKPLNLELYYKDSNLYVLMSDFFEKYIYQEQSDINDLLDDVEQNDINYSILISGIKSAFIKGITSMNSTQNINSVKVNDKDTMANEITIQLTKANVMRFESVFLSTLQKNSSFISEYDKSIGKKYELDDFFDFDQDKFEDRNITVRIYTSLFSGDLYGINYRDAENKTTIEVSKNEDGTYKLIETINSQKKLELSYTLEKKNATESVTSNYVINFVYLIDDVAYTFDFKFDLVEDVNPKDADANVKDSIKKDYLSEEEKNTILTKSSEIGPLGIELPKKISEYLNDKKNEETTSEENTSECVTNEDGTQTCANN